MIKSDKGNVVLAGSEIIIRAELACLFKCMREEACMDVDGIVKEALKNSTYSKEEINDRIEKKIRQSKNSLDLIRELFDAIKKED